MYALAGLALLAAMQTAAQDVGWERVRSLAPGQRIAIVTHNRNVVDAKLSQWSGAGLEVMRGNKTQSFALADVRKIQVQQKASRWKSAMWGAIAGFVPGFVCGVARAGYLSDQNNPSFGTRMGMGAGIGMFTAGIGAGIGALAGGYKYVTIYDAPGKRP